MRAVPRACWVVIGESRYVWQPIALRQKGRSRMKFCRASMVSVMFVAVCSSSDGSCEGPSRKLTHNDLIPGVGASMRRLR